MNLTTSANSRKDPSLQTVSGWLRMNQLPIGHTLADQLIKAGHLKSVIVAAPGSRRGVRLVESASLQEYLASLPTSLPRLVGNEKLARKNTTGRPKKAKTVAKEAAQ